MSQSTSNIIPLVSRQMSIQDIQVVCQPHAKRIKQPETIYTQLSQDSRKIVPNTAFVAVEAQK